jgi:iron complex outermembrane receptor protein
MSESIQSISKALSFTLIFFSITAVASDNEALNDHNIELIQVVGKKHFSQNNAVQNSHIIDINELDLPGSTLTDIISDLPGLDITGQGGLFQVYSIQGLSGARVQTQVSGIPIYSERRAGTSVSFISPFLLGNVEVLKGASSTFYGSGAIGGIVQVSPRHFEQFTFSSRYGIAGNERQHNIGWGNNDHSLAISYQKANNTKTATGNKLNSHYQQTSASYVAQWQLPHDINAKFLFMPSYGNDIGKANNDDFVHKKYTTYPSESHLISQLALLGSNWQGNIAVHQQQLDTSVERFNKRVNNINSEATDYSANFSQQWQSRKFSGLWGIDQQFRNNVKANEEELSLKNNTVKSGVNLSAQQYDSALFSHASLTIDNVRFNTGARINYIKQKNQQESAQTSFSDLAWTGFGNIDVDLSTDFQLNAAISRGFRFATLSERFYSGTTGRGQTLGNANLHPETATNYSASLNYQQVNFSVFSYSILNYIERINLDEDTRSYKNVYNATIQGAEFSLYQQLNSHLNMRFSGSFTRGENENGKQLSGMAANNLQLIANYHEDNWSAQLKVKHRFEKNKVAQGEKPLDTASIISAHWLYELTDQWQLIVSAENLFNDKYQLTTDKKSSFSSQRQVNIKISWQAN